MPTSSFPPFTRFFLALSLFICGCGRGRAPSGGVRALPSFSPAAATNALRAAAGLVAAATPRDAGTPGARRAALHLAGALRRRGIPASLDSFPSPTPRGEKTFHNVLGALPCGRGGAPWILLLSHFDTKSGAGPGFQGANDGASSCGLLLELAGILASARPRRANFLFAFLDGEECMEAYGENDGFHGSKRLARQMRDERRHVSAVILMDMVGDRDLKITVPRNVSRGLRVLALEAAEAVGERGRIGLFDGSIGDDHQAFLDAGFPAVDLIDFDFGSAPGLNDYWHTPADTLDKLSPDSLLSTGKIVIEMIRRLEAGE